MIEQKERLGKAAALSVGLNAAHGEIVLMENADTVPAPQTFDAFVEPFRDPTVGLVCSRVVPIVRHESVVSALSKTLWGVHEQVSRLVPKTGEAFAFRNRPIPLSADIEDDDTFIGAFVLSSGCKSVYSAQAIVYNRPAATLSDLLKQRFRINRQYYSLRRRRGVQMGTWAPQTMATALASYIRLHPKELPRVLTLVVVEEALRLAAVLDFVLHPSPLKIWDPVESTKDRISTNELH